MEKDFLPYEISLSLKELEFDEHCFAWYVSKDYGIEIGMVIKSDLIKESILAPTFSQAFRFFREKYKLSGIPTHQSYDIWDLETGECFIEKYPIESYEEAELACLRKLIEIVKTK
jgi:hypothetical protein